jgi:hypothetical protein
MLIQYLLVSTYIVLEYTNTVIHTKGKKQCNQTQLPLQENLIIDQLPWLSRKLVLPLSGRFKEKEKLVLPLYSYIQS